jgi:hypothetical protein
LLPSQWQERVKSHDTITFDAWLQRVLGDDAADREHQRFWASHDLVATADRWRPFVGDRFILVAADESDPDLVPRVFEQLLGLPAGLLVLPPVTNASLSANAAELVRRVNVLFEEEGWPDAAYHRLVQQAAVKQLIDAPRGASSELPIPSLPGWAAARVAELSERRIEELEARGVRVVGDLDGLRVPGPAEPTSGDVPRPEVVSLETAVRVVSALVEATISDRRSAGRARRRPASAPAEPGTAPAPALDELGGRELLRALGVRVRSVARSSRRAARKMP